jgi:hypothetical protein
LRHLTFTQPYQKKRLLAATDCKNRRRADHAPFFPFFAVLRGLTVLALGATSGLAASGKLVVYASQPNTNARQTIDTFRARHSAVQLPFVLDGTNRLMAKIRSDVVIGQAQAQVLLVADSVTMKALKAENLLLAHPAADVSAYPRGPAGACRHYRRCASSRGNSGGGAASPPD